jgi:hypothetical protein
VAQSKYVERSEWWSPEYSLHFRGGWKAQYERMIRWCERLHAWNMEYAFDHPHFWDDVWAFAIACFSLRDWLKNDGVITREVELHRLFEQSIELRICRDLANGMKHLSLDRKPSVETFAVGRQYKAPPFVVLTVNVAPKGRPEELRERLYNLVDLADACVNRWSAFLGSKGLIELNPIENSRG